MPKRARHTDPINSSTADSTASSTATAVRTDAATVGGAMPPLDEKSQQLLAALAELGEETAGNLARHVGIAYPTTTPKLRKLNSYGLAETRKAGNGQTVWCLTDTGRRYAAQGNTSPADEVADVTAVPGSTTADGGAESVPTVESPAASALPGDVLDELTDGTNVDARRILPDLAGALTVALDGPADEPREIPDTGEDKPDQANRTVEPVAGDGSGDGEDASADTTSADLSTARQTAGGGAAEPAAVDATSSNQTREADASDGGDTGGDTGGGAGSGTGPVQATADTEPVPAADATGSRPVRRAAGDLDRSILAILQARPDTVFKVGELCKLINKADEGTGLLEARPGAVVLAAQRLVKRRQAILAVERPVSFQLLPGAAAQPATAGTQPEPAETVTAASA